MRTHDPDRFAHEVGLPLRSEPTGREICRMAGDGPNGRIGSRSVQSSFMHFLLIDQTDPDVGLIIK
jgi:hypothetical protein